MLDYTTFTSLTLRPTTFLFSMDPRRAVTRNGILRNYQSLREILGKSISYRRLRGCSKAGAARRIHSFLVHQQRSSTPPAMNSSRELQGIRPYYSYFFLGGLPFNSADLVRVRAPRVVSLRHQGCLPPQRFAVGHVDLETSATCCSDVQRW